MIVCVAYVLYIKINDELSSGRDGGDGWCVAADQCPTLEMVTNSVDTELTWGGGRWCQCVYWHLSQRHQSIYR